ncbi:MAG: YcxB family protein [Anaeroplasma sp.]
MVIVETVFDEKVTKTLNKVSLKKLGLVMVIISLLFILIGVFNIIDGDLTGFIIWVSVGILYIPLVILLTKIIQKKSNKTLSLLSVQTKERYEFDNESIIIKQEKGDDYYSETRAKYNYLFKALETKDDFILYISNVQAHVIPKGKIIEGSVGELREILRRNLNDKFKGL